MVLSEEFLRKLHVDRGMTVYEISMYTKTPINDINSLLLSYGMISVAAVASVSDDVLLTKISNTGTGAAQTIPHGLKINGHGIIPDGVSVVPTMIATSVTGLYADDVNVYLTVTQFKDYKLTTWYNR